MTDAIRDRAAEWALWEERIQARAETQKRACENDALAILNAIDALEPPDA